MTAQEAMNPSASLTMKIASIVVHAAEYHMTNQCAPEDVVAIKGLLGDHDVREWLEALTAAACAPLMRSEPWPGYFKNVTP